MKGFHPFALTWEENQQLWSYTSEVLLFEWRHQNTDETIFYDRRYERFGVSFGSTLEMSEQDTYYYWDNVAARNKDRTRDWIILDIGLKLYHAHYGKFPIAQSPQPLVRGNPIFRNFQDVLYHVPSDPNIHNQLPYAYQSTDGQTYTLYMTYEKFSGDQVVPDMKDFSGPL